MAPLAILDVALWTLAVVGFVWAFGPPIGSMLRLSRFQGSAEADPQAVEPPSDDPDYEAKYRQLRALGFRPAGVVTEHYWCFGFDWYKPFPIRNLVSADGTCFAGLYRLVSEPWRVKIESLTCGGHIVRSIMPGTGPELRAGRLTRIEVPGRDLSALYARHQELLAQVVAERADTVAESTLEDWATVDADEQRDLVGGLAALPFLILPGLCFLIPGLFVLAVAYLGCGTGALVRGAAVALCLGAGAYGGFLKLLLPWAARHFVEADQAAPAV